MSNLFKILGIFVVFSCKAQQIYPLNTDYEEISQNSYLKDLDNELQPYVGTYKTSFNGNEVTLYITKLEKKPEKTAQKNYYMDALTVKYIIKNNSGITLQDTQNNNANNIEFYSISTRPDQNMVHFFYSGTNCSVGWGRIMLKKISPTQLSWEYRPDDIVTTASKCPPTLDTKIYLPETKDLIFTKQ